MIDPKRVTAVIVTRGGVDLTPILERLKCFKSVFVWDNSVREDRKVCGRYEAILISKGDYIYTQDDDCLVDAERLCAEYQPDEVLCNVLPSHQEFYRGIGMSLVGWGAIFPESRVDFGPYMAKHPIDEIFLRECDRVFTWLNYSHVRMVDIDVEHLPHALGKDRMGTETRHGSDLAEIRRRLATL